MKASANVENRVYGFIDNLQMETNQYFQKHYPSLTPPTIAMEEGSKFYRIVKREGSGGSVHCFVSKANGDIYKAAGYKAPAKHVRGNIFDSNYSFGKGVGIYGGTYLR